LIISFFINSSILFEGNEPTSGGFKNLLNGLLLIMYRNKGNKLIYIYLPNWIYFIISIIYFGS